MVLIPSRKSICSSVILRETTLRASKALSDTQMEPNLTSLSLWPSSTWCLAACLRIEATP